MPKSKRSKSLPDSVKLGAHTIPVAFTNTVEKFKAQGVFMTAPDMRIEVEAGLSQTEKASTLLHEVIEAINYAYGLGLSEGKIRVLEQVLLSLIRSNPGLVSTISGC